MAHRFGFVIGTAAVVAACCMLAASTSAAAVYGSWGGAQAVSGATVLNADQAGELTAVSCTGPGDCSAGGYYTDAFDDIMYFFGYGGDVLAYFSRYRTRLHGRSDIVRTSGLSKADVARLRTLYRTKDRLAPAAPRGLR